MAASRVEKMGNRQGLAGLIDHLRYHELSRQGLGLLLLLVCAWFAAPLGEARIMAGFVIAALGQLWRIYAAGVLQKNRRLATTGAYSLVRHPLYLGNFLILGGFTLASGSLLVLVVVVFFLLFYYPAAIRYEDHKLEGIFGDDWRAWSGTIPAMFPTRLKWQSNTEAQWSARQSLLRNGELVCTLFEIGAGIFLWYRAGA
ncbi:MAG: methyltransferase [Xanthomonadales bacterium]|nr:methyltransferase [Xanthomonadales bacterium]